MYHRENINNVLGLAKRHSRKLDGVPTARGLYVNNGCKVVVK